MKDIIICEGSTDLTLIQYFMETVNNWSYMSSKSLYQYKHTKKLAKQGKELWLGAAGGCGEIKKFFEKVIKVNANSSIESEIYENIIIISDRDEINTLENFENQLSEVMNEYKVNCFAPINNDTWINCSMKNAREQDINFRILLLIIPFEETGALETFLLNAVASKDIYDKHIIERGNEFINSIDPEEKYLSKRRNKTKAKFDVYFSVRTPAEQFLERQNILRDVRWEEYEEIQKSFKKLQELA